MNLKQTVRKNTHTEAYMNLSRVTNLELT